MNTGSGQSWRVDFQAQLRDIDLNRSDLIDVYFFGLSVSD